MSFDIIWSISAMNALALLNSWLFTILALRIESLIVSVLHIYSTMNASWLKVTHIIKFLDGVATIMVLDMDR